MRRVKRKAIKGNTTRRARLSCIMVTAVAAMLLSPVLEAACEMMLLLRSTACMSTNCCALTSSPKSFVLSPEPVKRSLQLQARRERPVEPELVEVRAVQVQQVNPDDAG